MASFEFYSPIGRFARITLLVFLFCCISLMHTEVGCGLERGWPFSFFECSAKGGSTTVNPVGLLFDFVVWWLVAAPMVLIAEFFQAKRRSPNTAITNDGSGQKTAK